MQSQELPPLQSQGAPETAPLPVVHEVKEHRRYFDDLIQFPRPRPWELRKNDRGYRAGDGLRVNEWDPTTSKPTGRTALCRIAWTSADWARRSRRCPRSCSSSASRCCKVTDGRPLQEQIKDFEESATFLRSLGGPAAPEPTTPGEP